MTGTPAGSAHGERTSIRHCPPASIRTDTRRELVAVGSATAPHSARTARYAATAASATAAVCAASAASQDRETVDGWVRSGLPYLRARDELLELFTERFIEHAMEAHGGDSAKAALASGIGRRYLQKLRAKAKK